MYNKRRENDLELLQWRGQDEKGNSKVFRISEMSDAHLQNVLMFLGRSRNPFINSVPTSNYIVAIVREQAKRAHEAHIASKVSAEEKENEDIVKGLKKVFSKSEFFKEKDQLSQMAK